MDCENICQNYTRLFLVKTRSKMSKVPKQKKPSQKKDPKTGETSNKLTPPDGSSNAVTSKGDVTSSSNTLAEKSPTPKKHRLGGNQNDAAAKKSVTNDTVVSNREDVEAFSKTCFRCTVFCTIPDI